MYGRYARIAAFPRFCVPAFLVHSIVCCGRQLANVRGRRWNIELEQVYWQCVATEELSWIKPRGGDSETK